MAGTVISNRLPPNIDVTKAPLAYGQRALPKLVSLKPQFRCNLEYNYNYRFEKYCS